jgi:hypothetical protein
MLKRIREWDHMLCLGVRKERNGRVGGLTSGCGDGGLLRVVVGALFGGMEGVWWDVFGFKSGVFGVVLGVCWFLWKEEFGDGEWGKVCESNLTGCAKWGGIGLLLNGDMSELKVFVAVSNALLECQC